MLGIFFADGALFYFFSEVIFMENFENRIYALKNNIIHALDKYYSLLSAGGKKEAGVYVAEYYLFSQSILECSNELDALCECLSKQIIKNDSENNYALRDTLSTFLDTALLLRRELEDYLCKTESATKEREAALPQRLRMLTDTAIRRLSLIAK